MVRLRWVLLGVFPLAPLLQGCHEPEPSYPLSVVAFDPQMVGTWRADVGAEHNATIDITISPRTLPESDGRTLPEPFADVKSGAPAERTPAPNAFTASVAADVTADDGTREHVEIEFKGFMLAVDGRHYATFQPSAKQMNLAHLGGFVLPIHQVVKIQRDGDTATVWAPKVQIGWLPDVTWLDAPRGPLAEPDLGDINQEQQPRRVTMDIDRFVEVLRKYGGREDFWGEPGVLRRVR